MEATIAVPRTQPAPEQPVGPWWQTATIVAIFLGLAAAGALFQRHASQAGAAPAPRSPMTLYLSVMAAEWALVYWIWKASVRHTGTALRELIGGRWTGWRDVARDAVLALALWLVWMLVLALWSRVLGEGKAASINAMLPRAPVEVILWLALSITAGICEETIFRGYLQRQFAALTHSVWLGLVLQAALFGVGHGYQGLGATLRIAVFGVLYGLMALQRRSLRPGILAHAWSDVASGIFRI